jgi:catechol 2,3-dioxygenase-like lactoylglutathione lyase family enzyme
MAFVATAKPARARNFFRDTLGLHLVSEDEFALVFDAHGTMLRVTIVEEVRSAG